MKLTKTDFFLKVNEGSSYKVYVCKDHETAMIIHSLMMTAKINANDNYWSVSTNSGKGHDCRVPSFFHESEYWFTFVEHNNGDWNKEQTYELYLVS